MMLQITPDSPRRAVQGPLVVALAYDGLCTFEFAIVAEVFGLARPELGPGWYRFAAAAIEPGPLRAHGGLMVTTDGGMDLLARADVIVVPGWRGADAAAPSDLIDALVTAHARGARMASVCSGAFVLAATGLPDGRHAATHWRYADALRAARRAVAVDASVLYVVEDRVMTSAGSAAGIDLMLHIVHSDFGPDAANSVARRLVMPAHRTGGQAQFIERPVPKPRQGRLAPLLDRLRADLTRPWSIATMAAEAAMSERSFIRRFTDATGASPGEWLVSARVEEAKRLLETTAASVEEVAHLSGFGSVAMLRHHFSRTTALSPRDYRSAFGRRPGSQPPA